MRCWRSRCCWCWAGSGTFSGGAGDAGGAVGAALDVWHNFYGAPRTPNPSDAQIAHALEGNLCRCTGYVNIVAAVKQAAATLAAGAAQ